MFFTPPSTISRSTTSSTQTSESYDDSKCSFSGKYEICREKGSDKSPHRRYRCSRGSRSRAKDLYASGIGEKRRGFKFNFGPPQSVKEDYDLDHFQQPARSATLKGGILGLVKGCFGVGLLAMHESYKDCGLSTAIFLNIVVGIIMTYSMHELARSARKLYDRIQIPALTYIDFIEATCEFCPWACFREHSRKIRLIVESITCFYLFSVCAVCQLMLARAIMEIVKGKYVAPSNDKYFTSKRIYVASLLLPLSLLVVFVNIKNLAPFSIVWNFFIGTIALTCIYEAVTTGVKSLLGMPNFRSESGMFQLIGVTMFAIDGCGVTLQVENSIKESKDFPFVLLGGMPIVTLTSMIIGLFGYWSFGEISTAPITLNYSWRSFSHTIKFFFIFIMYMTFGINCWQPSSIVWRYISYYCDENQHWICEKVCKMMLLVATTVLAVAIPDTTKFIAVMGTFCIGILSFLLPNSISLFTDWQDPGPGRYYWRVWKTSFMVLLSLFIIIIGSTVNGIELVRNLQFRTRDAFT